MGASLNGDSCLLAFKPLGNATPRGTGLTPVTITRLGWSVTSEATHKRLCGFCPALLGCILSPGVGGRGTSHHTVKMNICSITERPRLRGTEASCQQPASSDLAVTWESYWKPDPPALVKLSVTAMLAAIIERNRMSPGVRIIQLSSSQIPELQRL